MADGRMVDLNADLGESFGAYTLGTDAQVMKLITSANVACAMHAGDPRIMDDTVRLSRRTPAFRSARTLASRTWSDSGGKSSTPLHARLKPTLCSRSVL